MLCSGFQLFSLCPSFWPCCRTQCWFGSSRNVSTVKAFTFLPSSLPSILNIFLNTIFPYQQTICRANHESCVITSALPMTVLTEISFKSITASINLPALQIQQDLVFENIHSKGGSDNMHSWLFFPSVAMSFYHNDKQWHLK